MFYSIQALPAQSTDLLDLVTDTTLIKLPDTIGHTSLQQPFVLDKRSQDGHILAITQRSKWLVIPVDHYLLFERPLADLVNDYMQDSLSITEGYKLVIDNLTYWHSNDAVFNNGMFLNGYTRLIDQSGSTIRDWQWEIKEVPDAEDEGQRIGMLIYDWMNRQKTALQQEKPAIPLSPFRYRRQIISWLDFIYLADGIILNGHLSLDFPADQQQSYSRGSAGIYYRKSSGHQSIAIGGYDQQWYWRINDFFVSRSNFTGRIGFNNYNEDKYEQVKWWNIFMVNITLNQTIEYRMRYLKGFFAGFGLHLNINALPQIVDRIEPGLIFTVGVYLP